GQNASPRQKAPTASRETLGPIVAVVAGRVLLWRRPYRPTRVSSAAHDPGHPGICRAASGLWRTGNGSGPEGRPARRDAVVELHAATPPRVAEACTDGDCGHHANDPPDGPAG